MSNTRQIQPIQIWTPSGEKEASILALTNFHNYHFDDGDGKVTYKIIGMEGDPASAVEYITADVNIPSSVIQQWGASDDIIWNYIANFLNLVLI